MDVFKCFRELNPQIIARYLRSYLGPEATHVYEYMLRAVMINDMKCGSNKDWVPMPNRLAWIVV